MPNIVTELPGPKARDYLAKSQQYEPRSIGYQEPLVWDKAIGCIITDVDGNQFLDWSSGVGNQFLDWSSGVLVANVGHCHPYYVEQVKAQAEKLFNCYDFISTPRVELAEKLVEISPKHLDKTAAPTRAGRSSVFMGRSTGGRWERLR